MTFPPVKTSVLATPPDPPLTAEELEQSRKRHEKEWADKTLNVLLALAAIDREIAGMLCDRIIDYFGPDDELGPMMASYLRLHREGKKSGRKKTRASFKTNEPNALASGGY